MSRKIPHHISEHAHMENPFWAFSLDVYGREGVKDACLDLQDRFIADVNIVLFLCWRHTMGMAAPSREDIRTMTGAIAPLNRDVIAPLRAARNALSSMESGGGHNTREKILTAELSSEQMAQAILFRSFPGESQPGPRAGRDLIRTLSLYLDVIGHDATRIQAAQPILRTLADKAGSYRQD